MEDSSASGKEVLTEGIQAVSPICPEERGMESLNRRLGLYFWRHFSQPDGCLALEGWVRELINYAALSSTLLRESKGSCLRTVIKDSICEDDEHSLCEI